LKIFHHRNEEDPRPWTRGRCVVQHRSESTSSFSAHGAT
jgi:hypothetical protein